MLNNETAAKIIYSQILLEYPNSSYANDSKACLNNMGKTDEQLVKEYSSAFQEQGIAVQELKNLASLKTSAKKITAAIELTIASSRGSSGRYRTKSPRRVPMAVHRPDRR